MLRSKVQAVSTETIQSPANSAAVPPAGAAPIDAAQLAEAFALFSRASEELTTTYNALQVQAAQLSERLAVLMGALPAAVVVLERKDKVVQVNRAAEALFPDAAPGMDWLVLLGRLQATETPGEYAFEHGDDARRLALSEANLESGEGRIVLLHDITDTHRMRLAAERNERLAAMGEMVAGLAHQLRTPLAAALLYTGNLRQAELDPAQRNHVADRALERLRYLERLIRDMLLFARGDSLGRQRFEVGALAAELTHTLEPLARARQLAFEVDCAAAGAELLGDRKALAGALTNLLENAIQVSPAGASVRFEVLRQAAQVSGLGVEAVAFSVCDQGPGIAPELQERLFEPFFTTRAEGTGLGLAIARGLARAHGGEISIRSEPGAGSCFIFSLPLAPLAGEGNDKENSKGNEEGLKAP